MNSYEYLTEMASHFTTEGDMFSEQMDEMIRLQRIVNKERSEILHILNNEGEKKMLKIIVKNVETEKYRCVKVKEGEENRLRNLKVGQMVQYYDGRSCGWETCKIEKIIDDKPTLSEHGVYQFWGGRRAGRATGMRGFCEDVAKKREELRAKEEYQKRPYFLVRLDPIKGKPDGKENLEKIKFPCWVLWKNGEYDKDSLGMLVSGFPNSEVEYQLIDMMEQVDIKNCCTIGRNTNLKRLMDKWHIEVIKGESVNV